MPALPVHLHRRHVPPRAARLAAALAVLPLVALAVMCWLGPALAPGDRWTGVALGCGAALLGLMGGMRFGYALKALDGKSNFAELGAALLPAAAGALSLALAPHVGAALQLAAFLVQALWDLTAAQAGRLPYWAARLRVEMTIGAVPALLAILGAAIFLPPT